ncbi:hypothetical protein KCU88_g3642, partial [Aureobasidium melanogenum]
MVQTRSGNQVSVSQGTVAAAKTRKRRASQIENEKENNPPDGASESGPRKTEMTLMDSAEKNLRDLEAIRAAKRKRDNNTTDGATANESANTTESATTPSTPKSNAIELDIHDPRPTPGRKVPPRGEPPNAFCPETDPEWMRNPEPLPPPAKKRMNAAEKDERLIEESARDPNSMFHDKYVCLKKGPRGSPTYDQAGFQLDYKKVKEAMQPKAYNKSSIVGGMERHLKKVEQEKAKMAEIFFRPGTVPQDLSPFDEAYWKDRVSKDLGIPFHKINVAAFQKWEREGFEKQWPSDYKSFSKAEKDRMLRLRMGCIYRK